MTSASNPWAVNTRTLELAAIFGAMVVALQLVGLGTIPVPNLSGGMTTLFIPVIIGAVVGGPVVGMFAGLVMGVIYLILFPSFGPLTHLPGRLIFPLVAWLVYRALQGQNRVVAAALAGVAGAITNTVLTIGLAVLQGHAGPEFFIAVAPQALVEAIAAAIVVPLVVVAVDRALQARAG